MKKNCLLLCLLIGCLSCGHFNRIIYECTVIYTIDDNTFLDIVAISMSEKCTPIVVTSDSTISISAVPTDVWHEEKVIYCGRRKCVVEKFEYKVVDNYKVNALTGDIDREE